MSIREVDLAQFSDFAREQIRAGQAYVEELARQQGVTTIRSAKDLRCEFLESDEELDEFLTAVKAGRHEDKVRDPLNE